MPTHRRHHDDAPLLDRWVHPRALCARLVLDALQAVVDAWRPDARGAAGAPASANDLVLRMHLPDHRGIRRMPDVLSQAPRADEPRARRMRIVIMILAGASMPAVAWFVWLAVREQVPGPVADCPSVAVRRRSGACSGVCGCSGIVACTTPHLARLTRSKTTDV